MCNHKQVARATRPKNPSGTLLIRSRMFCATPTKAPVLLILCKQFGCLHRIRSSIYIFTSHSYATPRSVPGILPVFLFLQHYLDIFGAMLTVLSFCLLDISVSL